MRHFLRIKLSYGQKVFLLATVPLIVAMLALGILVARESRTMSEREIAQLETQFINAKKAELRNYLSLARTAFGPVYGNALPDDENAKRRVKQMLAAMTYGNDGFYFVYDYQGNNLVSSRQTWLIERNWADLKDADGTPIVSELIALARQGAGYHSYIWPKASTGENTVMVSYVIGLQDWQWAIGTGIFIDDVLETAATARAETENRIRRTFIYIGLITLAAVMSVFLSGLVLNLRERRLAEDKLKALNQRVFDTQEEERGRVARELHDSISQILVGVRYTLELARRRQATGDTRAGDSLNSGIDHLNGAIQEVRRISRDLRPGILDDLGLGPALRNLAEDFGKRTGIEVAFETVVFRNRLDQDAKIALYRIAQEALTNAERHSGATKVSVLVRGTTSGALLRIQDNGKGIPAQNAEVPGLGLRNIAERVEQLDGTLRIISNKSGTIIEAQVPLTHMLPPPDQRKATP
jgi:two-component system NarL family sensor kinase